MSCKTAVRGRVYPWFYLRFAGLGKFATLRDKHHDMDLFLNIYASRKAAMIFAATGLLALSACSGGGSAIGDDLAMADTLTHHASIFVLADPGQGMVRADIANPWSDGKTLARYALVQRDSLLPENLDNDIKVIRVPVERRPFSPRSTLPPSTARRSRLA